MAPTPDNIVQDFFTSSSLENVAREDLINLTNDYPFYATPHFLLAKKMFIENAADATPALQKAALHFKNINWLNFLLNEQPVKYTRNDITTTEILSPADSVAILEAESNVDDAEITTEEFATTEDFTEDAIISSRLSNILQETAASFEKPAEPAAEIPVETTPYHRVDYFDSQGIKLDEEKANDKLGTQLKRFTDWLKQMKRTSPNMNNIETDMAGEIQAQNMAARSNDVKEIVTEAMAEVLIKQGKPEEAAQIYEKLSFQNPSKSAYFAAKIQELNS